MAGTFNSIDFTKNTNRNIKQHIPTSLEIAEDKIQNLSKSFWDAAQALQDIRDKKLYRKAYKSFPLYLSERWSITESYVSRLISANGVRLKLLKVEEIKKYEDRLPVAYSFYYILYGVPFVKQKVTVLKLLENSAKLTTTNLKELLFPPKSFTEIKIKRLRTAINTLTVFAEHFEIDEQFSNTDRGNRSKQNFTKALETVLNKLKIDAQSKPKGKK